MGIALQLWWLTMMVIMCGWMTVRAVEKNTAAVEEQTRILKAISQRASA